MRISVEKLTEQALALPADARAILADRLAESLDPLLEAEYRGLWAVEALRRLDEIRSKKAKPIPIEKAIAQVRKSLTDFPHIGNAISVNFQRLRNPCPLTLARTDPLCVATHNGSYAQ